MPNDDGTGPDGRGPMTGRGMGDCVSNPVNNSNIQNNLGRGRSGIGRGLGRGWTGTNRGAGVGRGFRGGFGRGPGRSSK